MSQIHEVTGILNSYSNSVVTSNGSNGVLKAANFIEYDYVEVDDDRWGNMVFSGSLNDKFEKLVGKEVTIKYVEKLQGKMKMRLVVGVVHNKKLEAIMVDDIEPTYNSLKGMYAAKGILASVAWLIVGGIIALVMSTGGNTELGIATVLGGLFLVILGVKKRKTKKLENLKLALDFAKENNRIK